MAENAPTPANAHSPPSTPGEPHRSSRRHVLLQIVIVLIIVCLLALPLILRKKPVVRMPPPVTISTTNAVKGDIDRVVWRLGTVTPIYTAMVSPRVDGQIVSVNYTEGQLVTTNDLLAEIDPEPYQAAVEQAEGQLARDKALLEGAQIDLGRYQDAYAKKAIPKQQVDDQLALVHQDQGTVKFDQGQLDSAKVQLAYCFIHAPIAGRAGLRLIDPGNVVHAANSNALVVIAQMQPITVEFSPEEDALPAIERQFQAGHKMTVEAWDHDKETKLATGTFLTTDSLIDIATGTIRVRALFENKEMTLFPNQFVNAKLIIDTLSNVTLIPTAAIQRNPQGAFVYVVAGEAANATDEDGTAPAGRATVAMRQITEGVTEGDTTSVEGLEPGESIATDNFNKLADGMTVNVRQPQGERHRGGGPGGGKHHQNQDKAQEDAS